MRDVRAHYIRANAGASVPSRYIILDTEANRTRTKKGEDQTWALAVAESLIFTRTGRVESARSRFATPMELWLWVSDFTRKKKRTVLYAHNCNYDLRISQALSCLPSLGWSLQDMRLDGKGSWSRWTRQSASLLICDSYSIFPVSLEKLATEIGMTKPALPSTDNREALFQRCEADVSILSKAIVLYIQWLRTGACGNWQMTGASQSWSHFRHNHMTHRILVHDDEEALQAERAAMYAGRCEAWKWGEIGHEKLWEYDWSNSYPRIARDTLLPARLLGTIPRPSIASVGSVWNRYAVLADCTITTNQPIAPYANGDRILWPVGTYRSTLWDPEIRLLREANAEIRVHRAWLYKREPVLKEWAEWIISSLYDTSGKCDQWQKLILKHWSRALIGRFGMRYRAWEQFATSTDSRIYTSDLVDLETQSKSELLQIGHDVFKFGELKETENACPQITGYIMSEARAKLWRVISSVGASNVYYVDTDSLVVNQDGHNAIWRCRGERDFAGLRSKGTYLHSIIYGPRAIILGRKPTVAGMPRGSVRVSSHEWIGELWRGCQESIRRGEHDMVRIDLRMHTVRYSDSRRYLGDNGRTFAYRMPEYVPDGPYRTPATRFERAVLNGYPAMLAHSKTSKHMPRLQTVKSDSANLRPMRT